MRTCAIVALLGLALTSRAASADADDRPGWTAPPVRPALAIEVEPDPPLAALAAGDRFTLRVVIVNGTVYGLPRLTVTVGGTGVRLSSRRRRVFRAIDGNGGAVELLIAGRLRAAHGTVRIEARSGMVDPDLAPFRATRTVVLGPPPAP